MMEQQEKEKEAAATGESSKEDGEASFIASAKYAGSKEGYVFQKVAPAEFDPPLPHTSTRRGRGRKAWDTIQTRYYSGGRTRARPRVLKQKRRERSGRPFTALSQHAACRCARRRLCPAFLISERPSRQS